MKLNLRTAVAKLFNSTGDVYYGMHFYPGVAEYKEKGDAFRVFLNEDTIRQMGPSFAGKPVFVDHVDEVSADLDTLKVEADGWVSESFFNDADGKHWVKFIVVSEKGRRAVRNGFRLSNCYTPTVFDRGGEWNGVSYLKEIKGGEYDHLALVSNPRYEESVLMSPEQFKEYNESKRLDLKRLANDGGQGVKLNLFKRAKIENSADLENVVVILPKSGREVQITTLVNEADEIEEKKKEKKEPRMANDDDMVNVGDAKMTVKELQNAYEAKCKNEQTVALAEEQVDFVDEDEHDLQNDAVDAADMENADDDEKKALKLKESEEKEVEAAKKKANAKAKADALRIANAKGNKEDFAPDRVPSLSFGGVQRGKERYG